MKTMTSTVHLLVGTQEFSKRVLFVHASIEACTSIFTGSTVQSIVVACEHCVFCSSLINGAYFNNYMV